MIRAFTQSTLHYFIFVQLYRKRELLKR